MRREYAVYSTYTHMGSVVDAMVVLAFPDCAFAISYSRYCTKRYIPTIRSTMGR